MSKLLREYLTYTSLEIDYYASLNKQVLGYEPPQVMVLHDNRLNSETIDRVLRLFERKGAITLKIPLCGSKRVNA